MGEQGPHVCAVAEAAYGRTEGDQSILVRGDIGAGETEIIKMLVRYLAHLGGPSGRTLEQQIQKSNPILEAFGHAKTDTNSNSRRFSKSVELQFDNDRRISGAAVRTYLLETSRVCGFFDGTRNYNCFYQLCATSKYIEKYKLKKGFHYLDNYSCHESDGEEYNATIKAMEAVGISSEEQDAIFQVLAAILHLGNVDFVRVENASSAKFHLERAAAFFGCDVNDLKDSLSKQVICGVTERWDHAVAVALRDSLAKEVYSRLFEWLVEKINSSIGHDKDRDQNTLIRVVEINGYQNFKTNRFEQLCINFTNDMLEKHFDQNLCECQVPCKEIPYVFGYLNERAPGRDYFTDNLYDDSKSEFTITHYNGDIVTYQSDIFFAENHDYIVPQHQTFLSKSTSSFIRGLFPLPEGSSQSQRSSAGSRLIEQLQSLMKALDSTQLYYLTYNSVRQGVMGKIEIRWAGDPTIQTLDEFLHCFRILSFEVLDGNHDKKNVVREILKTVGIDRGYLIWETKVYLQARQLGILYCRKHEKLNNAAKIIQRKFRSYIPRKRFLRLRNVAIQLQSSCRGALERKHYNQMRREFIEKAYKQAAKSQFALEEMQGQLREAHDRLAKEREATKEAMEQAAKSQSSLEEMQAQLTEAHDHLLKEQEATKEAMEQRTLMTKRVEEIETKLEQFTKNNQDLGRIDLVQTDLVQTLDRPIDVSPIKEPPNDRNEMDTLINCVLQDIGFSHETPVAASIIYKSFFHWRSFEAETTSVFDRIIQMIGSAIETEESNVVLAYWLSNTSTLLLFLKRTLKTSAATAMLPQRRRTSTNLLGKMAQGFRTSPSTMAPPPPSPISQVEGKYPALLFMQQLTAYVDKIYGMVRDTLKKDISPLLALCIQAPRTLRASSVKDSSRSHANATAVQAIIGNWSSIVKSLNNSLKTMRANYVLPFLVRKIFTQMFAFINVQLFNSLLLRRECCSFSNGEYVKAGLAELEHWCSEATEEYVGCAWDELKHIRQAVAFLVMHQKQKKTLDEITHDLCPVLSIQQLYRISTLYWDDKYGTHSVSPDVISNMRVLMTEDSNNALSNSFLLDDDKSIPFSVDDIAKSMNQIDLSNIDAPCQLLENSNFHFLLPRHGLVEPEE